jgi:hypothetical protein
MDRAYWRSPDAYKRLQTFDAVGFAFQFLNRNPDFVRDRERVQEMDRQAVLGPAEVKAFARRWGLLPTSDE